MYIELLDSVAGTATYYGLDGPGSKLGEDVSGHTQTDPEAHPQWSVPCVE